jgi:hypothetical protein
MLKSKFFITVILTGLLLTCEKDSTVNNDNNNDFPIITYHFSGKVLDCLTKNSISGATIKIERFWGEAATWLEPGWTASSWTEYITDINGHFSASIAGKQGDGFNLFAYANSFWSPICGCEGHMISSSQMLINKIDNDSLVFELVPFNQEIKRPVNLYYILKDGSWPNNGIVYSPFHREGNSPGWLYWIYRDTLIRSEGHLLCKHILNVQGMHKDSSSSLGYVSRCILNDTILIPFEVKDITTIDKDTVNFKIEFDCMKDTIIFSIIDSKNK